MASVRMGGATAVGPSAHVAHLIRCTQLGLPASQLAEVDDVLGSMPCVTLKASCSIEARRRYRAACVVRSAALTAPLSVQGEEQTDIHENDFATCTVTVHLERLHDTRPVGTPYMPAKSDEGWWLLLGDLASNTLFAVQKARLAALVPANTVGADAADPVQVSLRAGVGLKRFRAAAKQGASPAEADNDGTQEFKLRFRAPQAGLFGLHVMCMSDTWIGCDTRVPLKLKVRVTVVLRCRRPARTHSLRPPTPGEQGNAGQGTCCCRRALVAHRRR